MLGICDHSLTAGIEFMSQGLDGGEHPVTPMAGRHLGESRVLRGTWSTLDSGVRRNDALLTGKLRG